MLQSKNLYKCIVRLKSFSFNPKYNNRNPRNLEQLGYERRHMGWNFQYPSRNWYLKLVFESSLRHTRARIMHHSTGLLLEASTVEPWAKHYLSSFRDVTAAERIGELIAYRCLCAGVYQVYFNLAEYSQDSERLLCFAEAVERSGLELCEADTVEFPPQQGIDYDKLPARSENMFIHGSRKFPWSKSEIESLYMRRETAEGTEGLGEPFPRRYTREQLYTGLDIVEKHRNELRLRLREQGIEYRFKGGDKY